MERVGEQRVRRLGDARGREADLERGGGGVVVYPRMQLLGAGHGQREPGLDDGRVDAGEVDLDPDVAGVDVGDGEDDG